MNPQDVRRLTVASYVSLVITVALWYFVIEPPQFRFSTILSLLYLGILLLPAVPLLRKKPRTYLWSSYLILIFFMHAIVETYANSSHRGYAIAELVLSCLYFIGATLCVRYERQGLFKP